MARPAAPTYDTIGRVYAHHRRPDPRIAAQVRAALGSARTVVDVGAGTGSYEPRDCTVVAVEPSAVMAAQRAAGAAPVVHGVAEHLPFADDSFDAALAVLTIHHWPDPVAGLREMRRVARAAAVLTFDVEVHAQFWLFGEYVPESSALPQAHPPSPEAVADVLDAHAVEPVPIPADCVDGFNVAFWNRPERYLDVETRACMSGLAMLPDVLVAERMARLRADLADGTWHARHGELIHQDSFDGGLRLVVRRP